MFRFRTRLVTYRCISFLITRSLRIFYQVDLQIRGKNRTVVELLIMKLNLLDKSNKVENTPDFKIRDSDSVVLIEDEENTKSHQVKCNTSSRTDTIIY